MTSATENKLEKAIVRIEEALKSIEKQNDLKFSNIQEKIEEVVEKVDRGKQFQRETFVTKTEHDQLRDWVRDVDARAKNNSNEQLKTKYAMWKLTVMLGIAVAIVSFLKDPIIEKLF